MLDNQNLQEVLNFFTNSLRRRIETGMLFVFESNVELDQSILSFQFKSSLLASAS